MKYLGRVKKYQNDIWDIEWVTIAFNEEWLANVLRLMDRAKDLKRDWDIFKHISLKDNLPSFYSGLEATLRDSNHIPPGEFVGWDFVGHLDNPTKLPHDVLLHISPGKISWSCSGESTSFETGVLLRNTIERLYKVCIDSKL